MALARPFYLAGLPLQFCTFVFNDFRDALPTTLFPFKLLHCCRGGCVYPPAADSRPESGSPLPFGDSANLCALCVSALSSLFHGSRMSDHGSLRCKSFRINTCRRSCKC